jgi:hypothetical protein
MAKAVSKKEARSQEPGARDKTADHVADWMHANCPSWSIDELLTHPDWALMMARDVLRKLGRKASDEEVHKVCKAALNARKRGDLRRDRV